MHGSHPLTMRMPEAIPQTPNNMLSLSIPVVYRSLGLWLTRHLFCHPVYQLKARSLILT